MKKVLLAVCCHQHWRRLHAQRKPQSFLTPYALVTLGTALSLRTHSHSEPMSSVSYLPMLPINFHTPLSKSMGKKSINIQGKKMSKHRCRKNYLWLQEGNRNSSHMDNFNKLCIKGQDPATMFSETLDSGVELTTLQECQVKTLLGQN